MKKRIIGIIILIVVVIGAIVFQNLHSSSSKSNTPVTSADGTAQDPVTLTGLVGGEKIAFLNDSTVQKTLKDKYGIILNYSKAGSVDMVTQDPGSNDFLFPSNQVDLQIFNEKHPGKVAKSDFVFQSPIVLYSWRDITDVLIKQGVVTKSGNTYYITNFNKLIDMVIQGKKWSDIGVNNLYGSVTIASTDPAQSNSGNTFSGLLADMLNSGNVVDENSVQKVLPQMKTFYSKLGFLQTSSDDMFAQYLRTGEGAEPIIVGYENQMIQFAQQNPQAWSSLKDKVRVLYPAPTVWSTHTVIALNQKAEPLISALQDPTLQQSAWTNYGFRSGVVGVQDNFNNIPVLGTPQSINQVVQMPKADVMENIINALH